MKTESWVNNSEFLDLITYALKDFLGVNDSGSVATKVMRNNYTAKSMSLNLFDRRPVSTHLSSMRQ